MQRGSPRQAIHMGGCCECQLTSTQVAAAVRVGWDAEEADVEGTCSSSRRYLFGLGLSKLESESDCHQTHPCIPHTVAGNCVLLFL